MDLKGTSPSLHFLDTRLVAVLYPSCDDVPLITSYASECSLTVHVGRIFTPGVSDHSRPRRWWWWWWALQGGAALISIRSMGSGPGESRVGRFAQHRISWWVRTDRADGTVVEAECAAPLEQNRAKQLLSTIRYRIPEVITLDVKLMNQTKKGVRDYIITSGQLIYTSH